VQLLDHRLADGERHVRGGHTLFALPYEGRLEGRLHDLGAHRGAHGSTAPPIYRRGGPFPVLRALDRPFPEGAAASHLHAIRKAAGGVTGARVHESELVHAELALGTEGFKRVMRGAKSERHAATNVAVDEEGGCQVVVPEFSEGLALGAQLAHGVDLFRFHG
jgi:hypothetical protein